MKLRMVQVIKYSVHVGVLWFKLIYLRSIAKQVIPTYINHSRPLIPGGIHLFFGRGLRGERSQTCPYMLSAKQGSIWYHFYNIFGMTRSGLNPRPPAHGANALTTEPPLWVYLPSDWWLTVINLKYLNCLIVPTFMWHS